ncbi:MAG: hypothetical protein MAG581_02543 [Deltaproteobacteria bacterium]|jgi:hypothetical protein|nr:hypothetical protein [Deltaproteobacteria bacterium]
MQEIDLELNHDVYIIQAEFSMNNKFESDSGIEYVHVRIPL